MPPRKVVLCIDDEAPALNLRKLVLEASGFSVLTASNGEKGLSVLDSRHVDAVVVDYSMPGMHGGVVAAEIRRRKPRLPVIMLTAYNFVIETLSNSVDVFIIKGEDPDLLVKRLDSLIRIRSHSHPELQNQYVVFADSARRYLDCTDGVCELLGYRRMDLMGMGIEDISYLPEKAAPLFTQFRQQGALEGEYVLRHRAGTPVRIRYHAHAFQDGCMAAVWEPI
jgi:CheY-like chemotaxis protein